MENIISFDDLRRFAESRWPNSIETTLLSDVRSIVVDGKRTGVIPDWISAGARKQGMDVLIADYRRNSYTMRLIAPPNALNSGDERAKLSKFPLE